VFRVVRGPVFALDLIILHPQIIKKVEKTFNHEKHKIHEINLLISCVLFSFSKKVTVRSDNTLFDISELFFCFTFFSCVSCGSWSRFCPEFILHPQFISEVEKPFDHEKHKKHEIKPLISCVLFTFYKNGIVRSDNTLSAISGLLFALLFFRVFRVVRGPVSALNLFFTRNSLVK
jgi:hypothetical protein